MGYIKDVIALRLQIKKIAGITGLWMLIGMLQFWYELSVLKTNDCSGLQNYAWSVFPIMLISVAVAGIIGGSFMVFFFEKWIRIWPYWKAALGILVAFTVVYMFVNVLAFFLGSGLGSVDAAPGESRPHTFIHFLQTIAFMRGYLTWLIVVLLTLLGLIIYDKYGPGTLSKLLTGKYFRPKIEERVFMFLDLRSSTTLAEGLGEEQYFNLLRDVIQDVTTPILASKGEIYQYVGDEIVISWPPAIAQHNANCLNCFFFIRDAIRKRADYYNQRYGMVPEYKAGLHYGNVIAGEIGVVKRDITYTGDVLNTTSRIQSKCNELGVDILLSKQLLDLLQLIPDRYHPQMIGSVALRGKSKDELLYTL